MESVPSLSGRARWVQSPGLARRFVWLVWSLLVRPIRPALFLMLIGAGVFLAWRAAVSFAGETGWSPATAGLDRRLDLAFASALPGSEDPRRAWEGEITRALDPGRHARPDLDLARSLAAALPRLAGEDRLALDVLSETAPRRSIEADLRARPAWQRQRRLERALASRLSEAEAAGLDRPELIFASELARQRYRRAAALFDPTLAGAERWFLDPRERVLRLDALPGFAPQLSSPVLLEGDVTALVREGCAAARANRLALPECGAIDPDRQADPAALTLAALVHASADGIEREGARLLLAAHRAGALSAGMSGTFSGSARGGDGERVLTALVDLLQEAATISAQPARYGGPAARAAREAFTRDRVARLSVVAREAGALRREVGALAALRLLGHAAGPEDIAGLGVIAAETGPATLALFTLHGDDAAALLGLTGEKRLAAPRAERLGLVALVLLMAAFALVLSAPAGRLIERLGGEPSGLRRAGDSARALILGRKV